jgi:hypothetical protein
MSHLVAGARCVYAEIQGRVTTASDAPLPSLSQAAIEHVKNGRNPRSCTLMGTSDGSLPGANTSRVSSTAAPSARAVTFCTIGNAYGGLPSNLIFPMGHFPLLLLLASHRWHTKALGSSAQIRSVSLLCCRYRVMTKSASKVARIIQILMRIRAARPRWRVLARILFRRASQSRTAYYLGEQVRAGTAGALFSTAMSVHTEGIFKWTRNCQATIPLFHFAARTDGLSPTREPRSELRLSLNA